MAILDTAETSIRHPVPIDSAQYSPITGQQIREARAILGWAQWRLAKVTRLALKTIIRGENGDPSALSGDRAQAVRSAFIQAGIDFAPDGSMSLCERKALNAGQMRRARECLGWTHGQVARRIGIGASALRAAETATTGSPLTADQIHSIHRLFVISGIAFGPDGNVEGSIQDP